MSPSQDRQVVFITGAGSGMGLESALHLAARGFHVYGTVFTETEDKALHQEAARRGVHLDSVRMDITQEAQTRSAVEHVIGRAGRIDVLIHFAGMSLRGFFEDLSLEEIRRVFEVNVFGIMALTQAVIPHMRQARRGRIIFTTSIAGRMPSMSLGGYASSKFAIEGLAESLRQELALFNIQVTLLEPGLILTPHFSVHRNRARRAKDPSSPYYLWFCQHEKIVDDLLARGSFTVADVARVVERILVCKNPRLRYVVGRKAKLVFWLRRYLPGEWFQNIYWSHVRRMVTQPRVQCTTLSPTVSEKPPEGAPATR